MNAMRAVFIVFTASALFAQDSPRAQFEVASIRPSAEQPQGTGAAAVRIDGAQVRFAGPTLKEYLAMANRVKVYQVSGPDWLGSQRFDVAATLPAGSSPSEIPEMLQRLLEERFQVKLHHEKKEFPVYVLEVGKDGLKMQENAPDPEAAQRDAKAPINRAGSGSAQGIAVDLGRGSSYNFSNNRFEAKRLTMPTLAEHLERFVDRPIVDMTSLKGSYDFTLEMTQEDYRVMLIQAAVTAGVVLPPQALRLLEGASTPSLFEALQRLGLKLDARKAPLDLLVIDEARKTPTDN